MTAPVAIRRRIPKRSPEHWFSLSKLDDPDTCWEWQGPRHGRDGYGVVRQAGRDIRAHRWAYEQTHGSIPEGLSICHRCDNPPCVNPAHLFIGTRADNTKDMWAKGRGRSNHGPRCVARVADRDWRQSGRCYRAATVGDFCEDHAPAEVSA